MLVRALLFLSLLFSDALDRDTFLFDVARSICDEAMRVATLISRTHHTVLRLVKCGLALVALLHGPTCAMLGCFGHSVVEFLFLDSVLIRRGEAAWKLEQIA